MINDSGTRRDDTSALKVINDAITQIEFGNIVTAYHALKDYRDTRAQNKAPGPDSIRPGVRKEDT
jgi:hypothetical protein